MKQIKLMLVLGGVLLSQVSFAAGEARKYGTAGCGLGSMIMGNGDGFFGQSLAVSTNAATGAQVFGITSGTSNCEPSGAAKGASLDETLPVVVAGNEYLLKMEAAQGRGEVLTAISSEMGCQSSESVAQKIKANFDGIFQGKPSSEEISSRILNQVRSDRSIVAQCSNLI